MFPELLILPHLKDVAREETNDVIDEEEDDIQFGDIEDIENPPSPGMQAIQEEEQEESRRPPSHEKYHKARDVTQIISELLPLFEKERFEKYLEGTHNFINLLREDVPEELLIFLQNPKKYEIILKEKSEDVNKAQSITPNISQDTSKNPEDVNKESSKEEEYGEINKLPDIHENLLPDMASLSVPPNGACLFATTSQHLIGDYKHYKWVRSMCHQFIINCWEGYYEGSLAIPFSTTVIIPKEHRKSPEPENHNPVDTSEENIQVKAATTSYQKVIHSEQEYLDFLKTDESIHSFAESNLELQVIANLFNIQICLFTYNISGLNNNSTRERFTWFSPVPEITITSNFAFGQSYNDTTMYIYHEDGVHYELLVNKPAHITEVIDKVPDASEEPQNCISPMNFRTGIKSKGRTKKSRTGMPQFNKKTSDLPDANTSKKRKANDEPNYFDLDLTPRIETPEQPLKRRRGRPKGSKNVNKTGQDKTVKLTVSNLKKVLEVPAVVGCPVCKDGQTFTGGAHKCTKCSKFIHPWCGRAEGEGYGESLVCLTCKP